MKKILFTLLMTCSIVLSTKAQELDHSSLQSLIASKEFIFVPTSMTPSGGSSRPVTSDFDVRVSGDSLVTYLPYIGRSYVAVMPGEGGVNFTSTEFEYKAKLRKKKWEINISPKDTRNVRELNFTIFENGYATLFVNSMNKQPVNYYGYIKRIN